MMKFEIDEQYLTDIPYEEYRSFTIVETGETIQNVRMTGTKDHPEFDKLRKKLAADGYIDMITMYWNGDIILKPFELNGMKFRKHDRFPCAAAMKIAFKVARENGRNRIGF